MLTSALPVGDLNPTRRRAFVTTTLIAINVVVFFLLQPSGACAEASFVFRWAAVPRELLTLDPLTQDELARMIGSTCAAGVGDKNVLASAVSAMFLHGGLMHLLGNMLFLWVFGNNIEDHLGHARFLAFYVGGGLAATAVFVAMNPRATTPLLGASGAIAAVLGAYLVLYPRAQIKAYVPFPLYLVAVVLPGLRISSWFLVFAIVLMPAWLVLGLWFVLQVVAASNPVAPGGVAYVAHVAGFIAGIVLLRVTADRSPRTA